MPEPNAELLDQIEALKSEIEALRDAAAPAVVEDKATEAALDALTDQVAALQASLVQAQRDVQDALAARDRELQEIRTELELARLDPGPDPDVERQLRELRTALADLQRAPGGLGEDDRLEQEQLRLLREEEERRLADLRRRREEEEAFQRARITSPSIAFGGGDQPGALAERTFEDASDFVVNGALPVRVTQAEVIANPGHTVIQGTMIQAVMETAVSSELPGQVRAVVSEDVHAHDGSRVLIPRGSKLIGRYRSGADIAQRRITIAWDRIVLPDDRTVVISAFGGDELGRSGTTGNVDTRFGERFGSAVLVSLIEALPGAAAASLDDDRLASLVEDGGDDLSNSLGSTVDDYLAIGPVIHVEHGTRITVMVDRDLEIF